MKKIIFITVIITLSLLISNAFSQESVNVSAGNANGSGGSISYSVGQVFFNISKSTTGSVVEGVQQPYEISVVTSIEEAIGINLFASVYPNPVTDHLTLRIDDYDIIGMLYQLFDINGRLLRNNQVTGNETIITMVHFTAGIYFLKVSDINRDIKTFKIIKN